MSHMSAGKASRRPRRRFSDEFEESAVRLVLDEGKSIGAVARELDLTASALGYWVKHAEAERSHGRTGLTKAEREELSALRKENRILRDEREIQKKRRPSSRSRNRKVSVHRRGEGHAFGANVVPVSARNAERVLCLADASHLETRAGRST